MFSVVATENAQRSSQQLRRRRRRSNDCSARLRPPFSPLITALVGEVASGLCYLKDLSELLPKILVAAETAAACRRRRRCGRCRRCRRCPQTAASTRRIHRRCPRCHHRRLRCRLRRHVRRVPDCRSVTGPSRLCFFLYGFIWHLGGR